MNSPREEISKLITKQEGQDLIFAMEANVKAYGQVYIDDFKREFLKSNFVTLTLAFEPGREFLLKVKKFFEENMGEGVILDLIVNEKIVGGASLICNNHYRDYTLASVMEKYLKTQ